MGRRSKDVLLLLLAVAALALALYTFRGKPKPIPPAPTTVAKAEAGDAGKAEAGKQQATESGEKSPEAVTAAGTTRSPFSAPGAAAASPTPVGPAAPVATQEGANPPGPGAGETPGAPGAPTVTGEQPAVPALVLTGIVAGRPTLAVIRENDERHFVKVGDRVGDSYRVQAIKRQEVVLAGKEGKVILRMGGRQ